ncbi:WD40-repeat-containing domain protein [Leucosporidium creatinivorum]|uniref:WD40-repeat-containing domain protein n=1 Tax=Leucosporidium creatinivorum TaxID=106004 RepID=A0A1Y2D941_9BASI|nr:WD40-repeat-containing domain protein [Leucosporidium creatinivorum]
MSLPVTHLPRITIQDSFPEVSREIREGLHAAEDVWVSCFLEGKASVHGKVRVLEREGGGEVEIEAREGVEAELVDQHSLRIACPTLKIPPTEVLFPSSAPVSLRGGVQKLAVAPDGRRVVVGGAGGAIRCRTLVGEGAGREISLKGHVGDVTAIKFFPSSEVVLTASLDMGIRVFSAVDGSNPRTLTGHTKPVTSLHILGRGRQILSSSLDGTLRLWNVAQAEVVKKWAFPQPVSDFALLGEEKEDGNIDGRLVLAAHTNGTASLVSLDAENGFHPLLQLTINSSSPIEAITLASSPDGAVVALGARNGTTSIFRLPSPLPSSPGDGAESLSPLLAFSRSTVAITSLVFSSSPPPPPASSSTDLTLLISSADGLPFSASLSLPPPSPTANSDVGSNGTTVKVQEEFAGLDTDAANQILEDQAGGIWVAGADGKARRYLRV